MLMNNSFMASKEEDFVFSFSLPVKNLNCLLPGKWTWAWTWDLRPHKQLLWKLWGNSLPLSFEHDYMLSHFLLELSCQHSWSCLCQYSHHVTPSCLILHCEEEKRLFGALTPVSCSDHLAGQRNKNLSRRCHRKAEAEGINKTWYFMLKMTLAKSRIALRLTDAIYLEGAFSPAALQRRILVRSQDSLRHSFYSTGLSKCDPWTCTAASAPFGNLSEVQILRTHPRPAESEPLRMGPSNQFNKTSGDSGAHSSLRTPGL